MNRRGIPFAAAGFQAEEILTALAGLVLARGKGQVMNFYPSCVTREGNTEAQARIARVFEPSDAVWRGMGNVPGSGLLLRSEFAACDAGSAGLDRDEKKNAACRCGEILMGKAEPVQCPLFGKVCTPDMPQGACMVSLEGSCYNYFINKRS